MQSQLVFCKSPRELGDSPTHPGDSDEVYASCCKIYGDPGCKRGLIPMTAIARPVWPSLRWEKKRSVWQAVQKSATSMLKAGTPAARS